MSILSAQSIQKRAVDNWMIHPFFYGQKLAHGLTYGLSPAGYDVRIKQPVTLAAGDFKLASIIERLQMPYDLIARVTDKSTWARKGLAVQNTVIEPGWNGWLTLELSNHGHDLLHIPARAPIAQIIFETLDEPTFMPYHGKYQNQGDDVQEAIFR